VEGPVSYLLMPANSIELLRSEWERAKLGAIDFVDSMPEDKLTFRPVPEVLNFAGQFIHVAKTNYVFGTAVFGVDRPEAAIESEENPNLWTRTALRQYVAQAYDFMIEGVAGMAAESLDEEIQFIKWKMPRHLILAKALEHHAHHRGQTAIYFRLQGIKPPSERLF
jgi:uncharacterized damage-inducible protein DinB